MRPLPQILEDIRRTISDRSPLIRAKVGGRRFFFEAEHRSEGELKHHSRYWVYLAQIGTLDKLEVILAEGRVPELFELTAAARNLFENLIWLRLFKDDERYGLVFYGMLIRQQLDNQNRFLEKVMNEIALFEDFDARDTAALHEAYADVFNGNHGDDQLAAAQERHEAAIAALDEEARRSFSLYAFQAKTNGYGFQATLLREKAVPVHRARIAEIEKEKSEFDSLVARSSLSLPYPPYGRWNWQQKAAEVGLSQQYEFLYRYTSVVLHSTPLNLITEKKLIPGEDAVLAEYVYGLINDIQDTIEATRFANEVDAVAIDVDE